LHRTSPSSAVQRSAHQDALARRYQIDPNSREEVVRELLPLASSLALKYKRGEEPYDDLLQVASLGLLKALERYDPDRGIPFFAFALPTITGELRRHYRDTGWSVHVPRSVQEMAQKVTVKERELFAETGRHPTIAETARALGADEESVLEGHLAGRGMRSSSIDRPADDEGEDDSGLAERFLRVTDDGFAAAENRATLGALTANLDDRELTILTMRFVQGHSQREIGAAIGVSQMQVSRLIRQSLARLRMDIERAQRREDAA
jgi:RNA polymerase sigma-B factor